MGFGWASSRDPAVVSGHPRRVESNPRAIPPRVEDSDLLAGDVAVLWLFALTQKTASVALSSSFPAPLISVEPEEANHPGTPGWVRPRG